jgi:hypothetical protein
MIALNHAKLIQQLSNVLILGDEYSLWILYHFNAKIVMKMSQIYYLEAFLKFFLYGCIVVLIVPCYEHIIYIYYKIHNIFSKFIEKKVALQG